MKLRFSRFAKLSMASLTCALTLITGNMRASAQSLPTYGAGPVQAWMPHDPKAVAILLHGITANSSALDRVAETLKADDVLTYGLDLRGHGNWYFNKPAHFIGRRCNYKASVGDVDALIRKIKQEHPGLPLYLIGESVGAAVALRAATNSTGLIDGLVLCAPGNKCARANPRWIIGDMLRACCFKKIDLTRYQRKYGTEDPYAIQALEHEPEIRSIFSARELLGTVHFIHNNAKVAAKLDPHVPVLVIQGTNDQTIRPMSAVKVFESLPSRDKRFVAVPGCGHVLLATPRLKPLVRDSIAGFIDTESEHLKAVAHTQQAFE